MIDWPMIAWGAGAGLTLVALLFSFAWNEPWWSSFAWGFAFGGCCAHVAYRWRHPR